MKTLKTAVAALAASLAVTALAGCPEHGADALGVGAECTGSEQCDSGDDAVELSCLTGFKGGYCGLVGCAANGDCPEDSICVTHDDGLNYCFRTCVEKAECNANRTADNESNCSSNITRVEAGTQKACVPPGQ